MDLENMQQTVAAWQARNFGHPRGGDLLLGVMEELGELTHAQLKGMQNIRHTPGEIIAQKVDAVGDLMIYLMNYCTAEGLSLADCLEHTWDDVVSKRDWRKDPKEGRADG